jgi:hypothetical protein
MQPTNLQRSNGYVECPRPSAAKTITSAAEARKVALLCGHHLDRLRVLAMASVVRLTADRLIGFWKGLIVCRGLWLKLGRGLVAPKARDVKTRGMTTPDEIASESKKA